MTYPPISIETSALWAKSSKTQPPQSPQWLPLVIHLADSAQIARKLWQGWLPVGVKHRIADALRDTMSDPDLSDDESEAVAEKLLVFLAAAHDLGKATPAFQSQLHTGHPLVDRLFTLDLLDNKLVHHLNLNRKNSPHNIASEQLLRTYRCNKSTACIIGAHHGIPASNSMMQSQKEFATKINYYGFNKEKWQAMQDEVLAFILNLADIHSVDELPEPQLETQVLLTGILIIIDWIASNETYFPYISLNDEWQSRFTPAAIAKRADRAWQIIDLPEPWEAGLDWLDDEDFYNERFGSEAHAFLPNTLQEHVLRLADEIDTPGIMVIEAPMGRGKTEAALAVAEAFAQRTGRSGLYFALPTQATSDGIFPRILNWVSAINEDSHERHSIKLLHGKAQFNDNYRALFLPKDEKISSNIYEDESSDRSNLPVVHQWFAGRKTAILSDFVVGTVDQILMMALKQRHFMLRHVGLAGKIVIIDECHAYDAYMSMYLEAAIKWLGAYHVPVIILSATLPAQKRIDLINAYINDPERCAADDTPDWESCLGYPLVTYSDGSAVHQTVIPETTPGSTVEIGAIANEEITDRLAALLSSGDGGCVGIIVNTVNRSQQLAAILRERFGTDVVELFHSRFLATERAAKEKHLLETLGRDGTNRPHTRIVVGTQVLEQSLDIDFDYLMTDLCPMDLLLQRIGRLHRHDRVRPANFAAPRCDVIGLNDEEFDKGSASIYGEYLLAVTKARLPQMIALPADIPALVQAVYRDDQSDLPQTEQLAEWAAKHHKQIADKTSRADDYRLDCQPRGWGASTMHGFLRIRTQDSEQHGEASVRDGEESLEVILLFRDADGSLFFRDRDGSVVTILPWETPNAEKAIALSRHRIRLPHSVCAYGKIGAIIKILEDENDKRYAALQSSPWLKGELILELDEQSGREISGFCLKYDVKLGLQDYQIESHQESTKE